jgi:hypothetical protein
VFFKLQKSVGSHSSLQDKYAYDPPRVAAKGPKVVVIAAYVNATPTPNAVPVPEAA